MTKGLWEVEQVLREYVKNLWNAEWMFIVNLDTTISGLQYLRFRWTGKNFSWSRLKYDQLSLFKIDRSEYKI